MFLGSALVLHINDRKRKSNSLENTESSESGSSFEDIPRKLQKRDDEYGSKSSHELVGDGENRNETCRELVDDGNSASLSSVRLTIKKLL